MATAEWRISSWLSTMTCARGGTAQSLRLLIWEPLTSGKGSTSVTQPLWTSASSSIV
jgi:hypothetical protein